MTKITPESIAIPLVPNPPVPLKEKNGGNRRNCGFGGRYSSRVFPWVKEHAGNKREQAGTGGLAEA